MRWFLAYSFSSCLDRMYMEVFLIWPVINKGMARFCAVVVFGIDPDRNRVTWETPSSEAIPFRRKPIRRTLGYSDYDVFLENDEGSRVYRCKKLF
jgi:hypothetical protein